MAPNNQYTPTTRCFLLELPAELRNRIYEFVLTVEPAADGRVYLKKRPTSKTDSTGSMVARHWHDPLEGRTRFSGKWVEETINFAPSNLSILQTCSQINDESCALFYSVNNIAVPIRGLVQGSYDRTILPPSKQFFRHTSDVRLTGITRLTILL